MPILYKIEAADCEPNNNIIPYEVKVVQLHDDANDYYDVATLEWGNWMASHFIVTLISELSQLYTPRQQLVPIIMHIVHATIVTAYQSDDADCKKIMQSIELQSLLCNAYMIYYAQDRKKSHQPYKSLLPTNTSILAMARESFNFWDTEVLIMRKKRDAIAGATMLLINFADAFQSTSPHLPPHTADDPIWKLLQGLKGAIPDDALGFAFTVFKTIEGPPLKPDPNSCYTELNNSSASRFKLRQYVSSNSAQINFATTENLHNHGYESVISESDDTDMSDRDGDYMQTPKFISNPLRRTVNPRILSRT